jgi:DNA-binding transcriptional ArsR family regulator
VDHDLENIFTEAHVRALSHPLRMRIMAMLGERPSSPARVAAALGERTNVVAYHVKVLHRLGIAELIDVRRGGGGLEHFYAVRRRPTFSDEAWEALAPEERAQMLAVMLRQIGAYVGRAALAGGFERRDVHISRTPLQLDETGWNTLAKAAKEWLRTIDRIERGIGERESTELFDAGCVILLFEAKPFSAAPDRAGPRPRRGRSPTRSTGHDAVL